MPFTDKGYDTRRFNQLLESLRGELETKLGTPIASGSDTVIGILNSIYANQLSIAENDLQALSNNLDINKAEGIYLDRLVGYIGLKRLQATPASGQLKIWRNSTTEVQSSQRFADTSGREYISVGSITTPLTSFTNIKLRPVTVTSGVVYSITLDGASISRTATGTDTSQTITDYFVNQIQDILNYDVSNVDSTIVVNSPDTSINSLSITTLQNFNIEEIASYNLVESVTEGFLQVTQDTITTIVSSNSTFIRVNNPIDFVNGRALESDEELRFRYELSFSRGGNTTFDNILSRILQLPNVTDAFIVENATNNQVGDLPPNSYHCIVVDGDVNNIAQTIWQSKPAGVELYGTETYFVEDIKGKSHPVKFSRPEKVYIFVEVSYSLYDEESFPSNGEALIRQAVIDYGSTLGLDNDVIPERFIGSIYRQVDGIDSLSIRIGKSSDINSTSPVGGYQTSRIPVGALELPTFTPSKVSVIDV